MRTPQNPRPQKPKPHRIQDCELHDWEPSWVLCNCGEGISAPNARKLCEAFREHRKAFGLTSD